MQSRRKKTTTAIVASVAAVLVLLGGTLAWTSISQQAVNEAIVDINPGGRLHDDFNGINKDVYVENFGDEETGVPIYARIRLDEYMEVGQDAGINKDVADRAVTVLGKDANPDLDINNVDTWLTYIPGDQDTANDAVANADRVFAPYWDWALGQDDAALLPYYMPTFNKNKDSLKADINGTYQGVVMPYDDYREYAATDTKTADAIYDWDDNSIDEPVPTETTSESTPINGANILLKEEEHTAAQISTVATVITMDQWINDYNKEPGPYWVYDTDGWAYWAQEILPGETTGLLLDGINLTMTPDDNWYYGINVVGQFTTAGDWEMYFAPEADGGAGETEITDAGKELMKIITTPKTIKAVLTANGTLANGTSPAYKLSFLSTRNEYTVGGTYVAPDALATLADGTTTGAEIKAVYEDNVGKKGYTTTADSTATPWYDYIASITAVSIDTEIEPTNTASWFRGMENLTDIKNLENLKTANVTNMSRMFQNCDGLTDLDLSGWDTSKVTSMAFMFENSSGLVNLDLSSWNTSEVTTMAYMFYNCTGLTTLDISGTGWDTGNVTNMNYMFRDCNVLSDLSSISNWDVSNVTSMNDMFLRCSALNELDLSGWDVSNVANMGRVFFGCTGLTELNLTGWETKTGNVTNMSYLFYNCSGLTTALDLSNWNVTNVTNNDNFATGAAAGMINEPDWSTSAVPTTTTTVAE